MELHLSIGDFVEVSIPPSNFGYDNSNKLLEAFSHTSVAVASLFIQRFDISGLGRGLESLAQSQKVTTIVLDSVQEIEERKMKGFQDTFHGFASCLERIFFHGTPPKNLFSAVTSSLCGSSSIQTVHVGSIAADHAPALCNLLGSCLKIVDFDLAEMDQMSTDLLKALATYMRDASSSPRMLNLSQKQLNHEHAQYLSELADTWKELTELNLNKNQLGSRGLQKLCSPTTRTISDSKLRELHMDENGIGDDEPLISIEGLCLRFPELSILSLNTNSLCNSDERVWAVLAANESLKSINIGGSCDDGVAWQTIYHVFRKNDYHVSLDWSANRFNQISLRVKSYKRGKEKCSVCLLENSSQPVRWRRLSELLIPDQFCIQMISIPSKALGVQEHKKLAASIIACPSIKSLWITGPLRISREESDDRKTLESYVDLLPHAKYLRELYFPFARVNYFDALRDRIHHSFKENHSVHWTRIAMNRSCKGASLPEYYALRNRIKFANPPLPLGLIPRVILHSGRHPNHSSYGPPWDAQTQPLESTFWAIRHILRNSFAHPQGSIAAIATTSERENLHRAHAQKQVKRV